MLSSLMHYSGADEEKFRKWNSRPARNSQIWIWWASADEWTGRGKERTTVTTTAASVTRKPCFGYGNKGEMFCTMFLYDRVFAPHETSSSEAQVVHLRHLECWVAFDARRSLLGLAAGTGETDDPYTRWIWIGKRLSAFQERFYSTQFLLVELLITMVFTRKNLQFPRNSICYRCHSVAKGKAIIANAPYQLCCCDQLGKRSL